MALCVRPPPQGFSHAKCSSKIFTEWPARASCSPHMEPEGPPPTIAIIAMKRSHRRSTPEAIRSYIGVALGRRSLSDGEDRQGESSQEYSTEDCGGGRGACPEAH